MATTLDTLFVELFMNSSAFAAQSKGVEKALNGIKTAAQATGLVVAAMFVKSGISQFVSQAQELGNLSRSVRENAEDLQAWGEAVKREGGTVEGFNSTVKKLSDDLMSIPLTGGNRFLLLVKAMANISNCTVPNLEEILNYLFQERGKVYVFDTGIMTMKYTFDFYLDEMEKAILNLPGIPPKPTGVGLTIVELPKKQIFGFNKTGFKPFNQAPLRRN